LQILASIQHESSFKKASTSWHGCIIQWWPCYCGTSK